MFECESCLNRLQVITIALSASGHDDCALYCVLEKIEQTKTRKSGEDSARQ